MPLIKEKTYTVDDIYALPEDERAELIDGQIYYMAPHLINVCHFPMYMLYCIAYLIAFNGLNE